MTNSLPVLGDITAIKDRILLSGLISICWGFLLKLSPIMCYAKDTILRELPRIYFKNRQVIIFNRGDGIYQSIDMSQY